MECVIVIVCYSSHDLREAHRCISLFFCPDRWRHVEIILSFIPKQNNFHDLGLKTTQIYTEIDYILALFTLQERVFTTLWCILGFDRLHAYKLLMI